MCVDNKLTIFRLKKDLLLIFDRLKGNNIIQEMFI